MPLKEKRPFRRNGLTSNDCLPYENLNKVVSLLLLLDL
jgi:hypothetical protein